MNSVDALDRQALPEDQPVHVQVDGAFLPVVDESWLREVAGLTLETEGRQAAELSLYVTGDERIRQFNRDYRATDAPTDVLSFGGDVPDFVGGPESSTYLGDVLISYPRAKAQAQAAGHSLEAELALLVVHGVLHLLDYDHEIEDARRRMWDRQACILNRLGLSIKLPTDTDTE
jgi:probable rRNA maturation factor